MRKFFTNSRILWLAVFVALVWTIWGDGYFLSSQLSPDGVSYLRMAGAAAQGHLFNPNGVSGHPGWFALWPVGYPWCIALIMKVTATDAFTAARLLATLIVGALLWIFARQARPAFPLLALSLLNLSFTGVFRVAYSEQPYILALVALCFALSAALRGTMCGWRHLVILTGLCLLAFLCRYVGVFTLVWLPATAVVMACLGRRTKGVLRVVSGAVVVAGFVVMGYLLMNHVMTGTFTGGHPGGMSDSFFMLFKRMCQALLNETQVLLFTTAWAIALFFAAGPGSFAGRKLGEGVPISDGMVFLVFGFLCNITVIVLRFLMPFDALGFRLLCPGTMLIVIGVVLRLRSRLKVDWSAALDAVPTPRLMAFLVLAALPASHFLSLDAELRRIIRLPPDVVHESYPIVRARVLEKYAGIEPGTRFSFPDKYPGENYWIDFLRPDILVDVPDSPDKGF